jgi:hypothetical protein
MFPEQMSKEFVFQTPSMPYSHEVGYFRYNTAKFLSKDDVLSSFLVRLCVFFSCFKYSLLLTIMLFNEPLNYSKAIIFGILKVDFHI